MMLIIGIILLCVVGFVAYKFLFDSDLSSNTR